MPAVLSVVAVTLLDSLCRRSLAVEVGIVVGCPDEWYKLILCVAYALCFYIRFASVVPHFMY